MKLIDAEAMLQDVQEQIALIKTLFPDEEINYISKILGITIKNQIDKMPTVDAIPIKWINEHSSDYFSGMEQMHLSKMISDWEKENGER